MDFQQLLSNETKLVMNVNESISLSSAYIIWHNIIWETTLVSENWLGEIFRTYKSNIKNIRISDHFTYKS